MAATTTPTTKTIKKRPPAAGRPQAKVTAKDNVSASAKMKPLDIAYIPDMAVYNEYVKREFDLGGGVQLQDMEVFDFAYEQQFNLLVEGPTGPGKTMASRAWAASRRMMLARIPSSVGIDASQLFGRFVPAGPNQYKWVDGPVTYVFRNGGVILWNEINFTPERIGSVMFGALDANREIILLDHESEAIRAHKGKGKCWCNEDNCDSKRVLIVADMNPDYLGTRELNAALRNRFALQLDWDYDDSVESQLVESDSLRSMAKAIRHQARQNGYDTPISTNMLMEFEKISRDTSVVFAGQMFVNHFKQDERPSIKMVVEQYIDKIKQELKTKVEVPVQTWDDNDGKNVADWLFAED